MSEHLEYTLDKFTFKVAADRFYTPEGVWAMADGDLVTVGVSDFFQQRNGDVAFAEVAEVETATSAALSAGVSFNDPFATIETIKVDIELACPVSGTIVAVNEKLEMEAEVINQDPYGEGWLAVIEATDWPADQTNLLTPAAYLEIMKVQAQEEAEDL